MRQWHTQDSKSFHSHRLHCLLLSASLSHSLRFFSSLLSVLQSSEQASYFSPYMLHTSTLHFTAPLSLHFSFSFYFYFSFCGNIYFLVLLKIYLFWSCKFVMHFGSVLLTLNTSLFPSWIHDYKKISVMLKTIKFGRILTSGIMALSAIHFLSWFYSFSFKRLPLICFCN